MTCAHMIRRHWMRLAAVSWIIIQQYTYNSMARPETPCRFFFYFFKRFFFTKHSTLVYDFSFLRNVIVTCTPRTHACATSNNDRVVVINVRTIRNRLRNFATTTTCSALLYIFFFYYYYNRSLWSEHSVH